MSALSTDVRPLMFRDWTPEQVATLPILTPWAIHPRSGVQGVLDEDERRADLHMRGLVFDLLACRAPWLLLIAAEARSLILADDGRVFVSLPSRGHHPVEVQGLAPWIDMLPWPNPKQTAH